MNSADFINQLKQSKGTSLLWRMRTEEHPRGKISFGYLVLFTGPEREVAEAYYRQMQDVVQENAVLMLDALQQSVDKPPRRPSDTLLEQFYTAVSELAIEEMLAHSASHPDIMTAVELLASAKAGTIRRDLMIKPRQLYLSLASIWVEQANAMGLLANTIRYVLTQKDGQEIYKIEYESSKRVFCVPNGVIVK